MNNLNSILIEGNMVRDPMYHTTPKGTPVCNFSLASNRFFRQDTGLEKEVSFFEVETWAKLAESCNSLGKKGRGVRVVGRLKQDRWTGNDGKPRSRITIVAEHVEFRPEFKKESETEKNDAFTGSEIAAEAETAMQDYPAIPQYAECENAAIMEEVLEPVVF
ncbi:MAG: single-stranded DNA-binding protein [Treponema sp.]|nr:single-stranded DNA-binding protein [Treponema sp.]